MRSRHDEKPSAPAFESEAWRRQQKRRRRRRRLFVASAITVVAGVAAWQITLALISPVSCGPGMFVDQGDCVGVTDGSHIFYPSLTGVENKIATENAAVQGAGDFVSVALLTALSYTSTSDVSLARIREELEGAYTAQNYLNGQGFRPRIRLLLANEGSQEQAWSQVTGDLQAEPAAQKLVAVVGVGLSTTPTLEAARKLAAGATPLPMIGTIDTADGLNSNGPPASLAGPALSGPIQGLARVEPTTGDEVTLLRQYLVTGPRPIKRAMLVYDTNAQDLYTKTLGNDFHDRFRPELIGSERYDGAPGSIAIANEFSAIAGEVCPPGTVNPPAVLYAGRDSLLPLLLSQLRGLTMCPGRTITVVTGSDAEALPASSTSPNPNGPSISVVYPNLVDASRAGPTYTSAFRAAFGPADLGASWAIMTYDGVAAAEQAARTAAGGSATLLPSRADVASALFDFNQPSHALTGAAGDFLLQSDGDEQCQGMPIVTDSNGSVSVLPPAPQKGCP